MNPSYNPFSPSGQPQQSCGPNQPQNVNFMDQLIGMSQSLQQERQRQELMQSLMPALMGQGSAPPFRQGGGGGGGYGYGGNNRDRQLQCYHICKDGKRCNGAHYAKDCPKAADEREERIQAEVERRTKIKEEATPTPTLKTEPPPPLPPLLPYGSAMMMPPPTMPTQQLQQLQMQQVQQQPQLGAQMPASELAVCTPAPQQNVPLAENMKEIFKESLEELKGELTNAWEPHFNEVKALSHENAAKGVLIRSELNSLMAKVSESRKEIEVLKAGLEGQGTMITKLQQKRAKPVDEEEINIADLAGTPLTNPQAKKKKSKKNATPATAPPSTRSPRIAAKQLARAESSK